MKLKNHKLWHRLSLGLPVVVIVFIVLFGFSWWKVALCVGLLVARSVIIRANGCDHCGNPIAFDVTKRRWQRLLPDHCTSCHLKIT